MEGKKTLKVSAAICDVRFATEETLSAYEKVTIGCATLITNPEATALLRRCQVKIGAANVVNVEGDVRMNTVNGSMCLTPNQIPPEGKNILVVNGSLDIVPGCEEVLKSYVSMTVNGSVDVPESMTGLLGGVTVNGTIHAYPDGCIRLKPTTVLDRTFPLRAKQDALYYAANRIVALAGDIDFRKLAEKNVRFSTGELLITEGLVEAALPLFDEKADIRILPDGCAWLDDDTVLDETVIRRHGGKLYIDGDLILLEDGPWLDQVSYLRVDGDVLVTRDLEDRLNAMDADYDTLYHVGGTLQMDKSNARLTRDMLESAERGVSFVSCANVEVDEDIPVQLLREKLVSVIACANVVCTGEQQAVIEQVACDTVNIGPEDDGEDGQEEDPNIVSVRAAFYTL